MQKPTQPQKPIRKLNKDILLINIEALNSQNSEFISSIENEQQYTSYQYIKLSDLLNKLPNNNVINDAYLLVQFSEGEYGDQFEGLCLTVENKNSFNDQLYESELNAYKQQLKIYNQEMKKFKKIEKENLIKKLEKIKNKTDRQLNKLKNAKTRIS